MEGIYSSTICSVKNEFDNQVTGVMQEAPSIIGITTYDS